MSAPDTSTDRTTAQRVAARALASEFGPAIVWSAPCEDASGTQLLWTDTTPTLALLVTRDGAVCSPRNGAEEETWTREADAFDRPRVTAATRAILNAIARIEQHPFTVIAASRAPTRPLLDRRRRSDG